MSLSDLASLGSFVSGAAVLVSLIFLYFQLRQMNRQVLQAEKNQQAAIRQGRANRLIDVFMRVAESPPLSESRQKWFAGREDLTRAEYDRAMAYFRAMVTNWEDSFYQHKEGTLSDNAFSAFVLGLRWNLAAPGIRASWKAERPRFVPDFVAFIDEMIAATPVAKADDPLERWKAIVAAENASVRTSKPLADAIVRVEAAP